MSDLPRIDDSWQLSMFPPTPHEVCKGVGLPWWTAIQLHKEELINFDPESTSELNEPKIAELSFVGSLVAANCSPDTLQELLSGLTRPYCYSHSQIYYDWSSKAWKAFPEMPEPPDEYDATFQWLESLHENEDADTLNDVRNQIDHLLKTLPKDNNQ